MREPSGNMSGRLAVMAFHAVAAGVFFFVLQRFGLDASLASSLLTALFFAVAAGALAWSQQAR